MVSHPSTVIHVSMRLCSAVQALTPPPARNWSKYHLYLAILEWTATALILIFQLSFAADLNYVSCLEVSYRSKLGPQQHKQEKEGEEEEDACRLFP